MSIISEAINDLQREVNNLERQVDQLYTLIEDEKKEEQTSSSNKKWLWDKEKLETALNAFNVAFDWEDNPYVDESVCWQVKEALEKMLKETEEDE